ncbi:MAG: ATP-dependent DNA ligase [Myxococcaceae bacterium]|nr:ATP-dependent DNA ligase [Myxococcaceae bacterium]
MKDVDAALEVLKSLSGKGSGAEKNRQLTALFSKATGLEQAFLQQLLGGGLRQGALEGLMIEAIAQASQISSGRVRNALMYSGQIGVIAHAALTGGVYALDAFRLTLMRPVQPMLAQPAGDLDEALDELGEAAFDVKLDGARIQVHRDGQEVRVYSRDGNDVTHAVPEVVEAVLALPQKTLVLDGEAIALKTDGTPHPFQVTMRRFGRKLDVASLRSDLPLTPIFFDVLHADGADAMALPLAERTKLMESLLPEPLRIRRQLKLDADGANALYSDVLRQGHEGLVMKSLASPYEAGRRGGAWRKLKPAHTLDLVILAAEWGSGRREGYLSNVHLGARDPSTGGFAMLGKTFKGMTDAMLAWQTQWFLAHALSHDNFTVYVKPELVAEVAFDGVQASTTYPSGMALRFARIKRYREDKPASESDTVETVRRIAAH